MRGSETEKYVRCSLTLTNIGPYKRLVNIGKLEKIHRVKNSQYIAGKCIPTLYDRELNYLKRECR